MHLKYEGKRSEQAILKIKHNSQLKFIRGIKNASSKLILGENGRILRLLLSKEKFRNKIDLVYIDPPFATDNIFTISDEKASTISRINNAPIAYKDNLKGSEYLEFIRERLILLRELLSPKGSIYFHIDYKIGHYIKILMDEIFGEENFRNDITRIKCNPKNFPRKSYGNIKDMILFYTKSDDFIWNDPRVPLTEKDIERLYKKTDSQGRKYTTIPLHAPGETINGVTGMKWKGQYPPKGRHWRCPPKKLDELDNKGLIEWSKNNVPRKKIFADEHKGKRIQDILYFKDPQNPIYPTEKNLDLIKLFISASSNKNSIVLDCFCGSGTTLKAAQELGRYWIGIDKSKKAIDISFNRMYNSQKKLFQNDNFEYLEEQLL
ncbi:MAG: site-specific DNA-methyltransferase [Asgard group archaeon]|nr:site-specific DNA-methyltransferase [Asgard group archaeon]